MTELYEPTPQQMLSDAIVQDFLAEWEAADRNVPIIVQVDVNVTVKINE